MRKRFFAVLSEYSPHLNAAHCNQPAICSCYTWSPWRLLLTLSLVTWPPRHTKPVARAPCALCTACSFSLCRFLLRSLCTACQTVDGFHSTTLQMWGDMVVTAAFRFMSTLGPCADLKQTQPSPPYHPICKVVE